MLSPQLANKVLLAHPGTQHASHLARELYVRSYLRCFYTCFALSAQSVVFKVAQTVFSILGKDKELKNRAIAILPAHKIFCYPLLEITALQKAKKGIAPATVFRERNKAFQDKIPDKVLQAVEVVIGFDTSSLALAQKAKRLGKKFILEQSIAHPLLANQYVAHIREAFPEWKNSWQEKPGEEIADETQEHTLSDLVVVPSHFVANSLIRNGVKEEKIRINPFGTDLTHFKPMLVRKEENPVIFLFVGSLTARKGLPVLLDAWSKLIRQSGCDCELWIAGAGSLPAPVVASLDSSVRLLGKIAREDLPTLYNQAHVFVFPSFFEGLAMVQLEAAACGLPIIGTSASGATEIVEEGVTGFVIEPGNTDQLIDKMALLRNNPSLLCTMQIAATEKCQQWGWKSYGDRWEAILNELK